MDLVRKNNHNEVFTYQRDEEVVIGTLSYAHVTIKHTKCITYKTVKVKAPDIHVESRIINAESKSIGEEFLETNLKNTNNQVVLIDNDTSSLTMTQHTPQDYVALQEFKDSTQGMIEMMESNYHMNMQDGKVTIAVHQSCFNRENCAQPIDLEPYNRAAQQLSPAIAERIYQNLATHYPITASSPLLASVNQKSISVQEALFLRTYQNMTKGTNNILDNIT